MTAPLLAHPHTGAPSKALGGGSACVNATHRPPFWHTPRIGSSTEGPRGTGRMRQRHSYTQFWHTPHTVRGPIGSSTERPSGRVRMAPPPHFGAPLTRFVAP